MILTSLLLVNNLALFIIEVIGYHVCHSVLMLLDGYYHLCQLILCTVRIVSRRIQFVYTPRHTYGLARVGVVGELVAFVSFLSLSVSVFLESLKHVFDIIVVYPSREKNNSIVLTAHGKEHHHSLIDHPDFILGVGIYATISNVLLGLGVLYVVIKRTKEMTRQLTQRRPSLKQPLPKTNLSNSLLITDTLPIRHSLFQIFNMLVGPLAILICGILLRKLSDQKTRLMYMRLIDPLTCCILFLSCLLMIALPIREVMHLVLQAKPGGLKSDQLETKLIEMVPGVTKIHQLHIWRLTPQKTLATIHVVFDTTKNLLKMYQDIQFIFQTYRIDHVTIQPEFELRYEEIRRLGCQQQISNESVECSVLQCAKDTPRQRPVHRKRTKGSKNSPFHRRSSAGLDDEDDGDKENDSESDTESVEEENSSMNHPQTK